MVTIYKAVQFTSKRSRSVSVSKIGLDKNTENQAALTILSTRDGHALRLVCGRTIV